MIEEVEKNSNKSLGDNEIASLMKTLASKNYRENVSFPKGLYSLLNLYLFQKQQIKISKRITQFLKIQKKSKYPRKIKRVKYLSWKMNPTIKLKLTEKI